MHLYANSGSCNLGRTFPSVLPVSAWANQHAAAVLDPWVPQLVLSGGAHAEVTTGRASLPGAGTGCSGPSTEHRPAACPGAAAKTWPPKPVFLEAAGRQRCYKRSSPRSDAK